MNSFIIKNAVKKILNKKFVYIFFILQISVSFALFLVFYNVGQSINAEYKEMINDGTAKSFHFNTSAVIEANVVIGPGMITDSRETYKADYDDYLFLKSEYGDILSVSYVERVMAPFLKDGELNAFFIYFVTDEFFYNIYRNSEITDFSESKTMYAPIHFIDYFENYNTDTDSSSSELNIFINSKIDNYSFSQIENIYNDTYDYFYHDPIIPYDDSSYYKSYLNEVLIAPIELFWDKGYVESEGTLTVNFYDGADVKILGEIAEYFEAKLGIAGAECEFTSSLAEYEKLAKSNIELANLFIMISVFSYVIMTVGFIGLMLVMFNRQEKRYAILLALGVTPGRLCLETVLEVEFIILIGNIIGVVLYFIALDNVVNIFPSITLQKDMFAMILLFFIFIVTGFLICAAAIRKIVKIAPNDILKKE